MESLKHPMPAIFFGHGNPMNALESNEWTEGWRAIGIDLPRPRAVVCVSAHWYIEDLQVTAMVRPRTIHDFGGFPRELYEVNYPAPGDPALAARIAELLKPETVLPRFVNALPTRFEVGEGPVVFNAFQIDIDPATGRAIQVERIQRLVEV